MPGGEITTTHVDSTKRVVQTGLVKVRLQDPVHSIRVHFVNVNGCRISEGSAKSKDFLICLCVIQDVIVPSFITIILREVNTNSFKSL